MSSVIPAQGERFEDWLVRFAEVEGRELFARRAAAAHAEREKARAMRAKRAMASFEKLRAGKTVLVSGKAPTWRQAGPLLAATDGGVVNSVFALGGMGAVAPMVAGPQHAEG